LQAWLLAAGVFLVGHPVVVVGVVLCGCLAVTGWWADQLARDLGASRVLAYVLVALLASSPLLVSTVGLETYLGAAVVLGVAPSANGARARLGRAGISRRDEARGPHGPHPQCEHRRHFVDRQQALREPDRDWLPHRHPQQPRHGNHDEVGNER
jgi:hypothetical protein